jgi:hypothetical protein
MLDEGKVEHYQEIEPSYVGDVLRLTLLAPEMILDGRQPPGLQFEQLRKPFPLEWRVQRRAIHGGEGHSAT